MAKGQFWIFLTFILAVGLHRPAAAVEKLEYAYPDVSVWTTKRTPFGRLDNPLLRLADQIFTKADIAWTSKDYPAKRMFYRLINGESKFSMLVRAPQLLNGCCIISKKPVAVVELKAFHYKKMPQITQWTDLKGKSVIVIRGYSYAGLLNFLQAPDNEISVITADDHEKAFQLIKENKADYVIDYAKPAEEILTQMPLNNLTSSAISLADVHMILHKSYPDAKNVMDKLEAIVGTLDISWYVEKSQR